MNVEKRRNQLYALLGDLPSKDRSITSFKVGEEVRSTYILERLVLHLNGTNPVPAFFVRPLHHNGPYPTILFNHSHGGKYELGKKELIDGNSYLYDVPYAEELTSIGIAAMCIDSWGFGERMGKSENELFKEMILNGQVLWGNMVYDHLRAIDYLTSRDDVDTNRIGTMGISMGSTMSWWIAALDTRIKVCIDICGLVDYHSLIEDRGLEGHAIYFYVPNLLKHFSTAEINALIAPRPHLSLQGDYDRLVPSKGVDRIDQHLKTIYFKAGASDAWKLFRYPIGHFETAEMREEIKAFLQEQFSISFS
ncbi:dienelactone hydrolase family protein [Evansella cellulosilytica]|uniref:dienelactone hydrolase family protein n=1 Tax=Evansella cellulosilytica TaxID=1413 RepID=UPI0003009FE3|nr:CocE/NonD family hydrolase [Evansella cellulosilytica]